MTLKTFLTAETTVQRSTVLVAWALVASVFGAIWHFEVTLASGGITCGDLGGVVNGIWGSSGCLVWHVYLYVLLAVVQITFFYLLWRN